MTCQEMCAVVVGSHTQRGQHVLELAGGGVVGCQDTSPPVSPLLASQGKYISLDRETKGKYNSDNDKGQYILGQRQSFVTLDGKEIGIFM